MKKEGKFITTRNQRVQNILDGHPDPPVDDAWVLLNKISAENFPHRTMPHVPADGQEFFKAMQDGAWKGRRCFIIGGGPSLKGFDFSRLKGELVIGVNRAYEKFPCSILFATDKNYYQWLTGGEMGSEARKKFDEFEGYKVWLEIGQKRFKGTYSVKGLNGKGLSFSMKQGIYHGENSGFGALNLAVCLGANPIYLLGYDMKGRDGLQDWWHKGYPQTQGEGVYRKFKPYFDHVAPILEEKGIEVRNMNRDSALRCFKFADLKQVDKSLTVYNYDDRLDSKLVIKRKHDTLKFTGCHGLGDNFFQRPVIKDLAKIYKTIYLMTALPELYWDIPNVKFLRPTTTNLRTQKKHFEGLPKKTWSEKPQKADVVRYDQIGPPSEEKIQTRYVELENSEDFDFTFPVRNAWIQDAKKVIAGLSLGGKKLCIIRRPTLRKEWFCSSRNPKIEHYQLLIDRYKDEYFFLSIADVEPKKEWFDGELTGLDKEFNHGELPLITIFGLLKLADMVITYQSFFSVASIAVRAKCFCIFGGVAHPGRTLRKRLGLQNFGYVAPEPFCDCGKMDHDCNKEIPKVKLLRAFEELKTRPRRIKTVSVGSAPGMGDTHWVLTKMESFKERHAIDELLIAVHRDPVHYYTADFLEFVPFVDGVIERPDTLRISAMYDKNAPSAMLKNTQDLDYIIDCGAPMWLKGTKLEDILPEYESNFHYQIELPEIALQLAQAVKKSNKGKLVLFFTSSVGNNKNWNPGSWSAENWMELAELIHKYSGIRPMLIGAKWDRDYASKVLSLDQKGIIQDNVGATDIAQTLALLKEASLVVAFPCGIPIMATYFGRPTVMFWPINGISKGGRFDEPFMHTWVPPKTRKNGRYIPVTYDKPQATPDWIFMRTKEFL